MYTLVTEKRLKHADMKTGKSLIKRAYFIFLAHV